MSSIPQHLWVPLGAVSAALIAGLFSYLALVISKENKVSELRQSWIDELREELSEFLASVRIVDYKLRALFRQHGPKIPPEAQEKAISEPYEMGLIALNKVLLRLNPEGEKNQKSAALIKEIKVIQDFFRDKEFGKASDHVSTVREVAQVLLRSEWARVKKGEPIYYWSKRGFALILALSSLILAVVLFRSTFT